MNRIDREKKFQRGEKIHDIDLLSSAKREKILLLRSLSKLSNSARLYIYNSRPTCSVCIVFYVTGRGANGVPGGQHTPRYYISRSISPFYLANGTVWRDADHYFSRNYFRSCQRHVWHAIRTLRTCCCRSEQRKRHAFCFHLNATDRSPPLMQRPFKN